MHSSRRTTRPSVAKHDVMVLILTCAIATVSFSRFITSVSALRPHLSGPLPPSPPSPSTRVCCHGCVLEAGTFELERSDAPAEVVPSSQAKSAMECARVCHTSQLCFEFQWLPQRGRRPTVPDSIVLSPQAARRPAFSMAAQSPARQLVLHLLGTLSLTALSSTSPPLPPDLLVQALFSVFFSPNSHAFMNQYLDLHGAQPLKLPTVLSSCRLHHTTETSSAITHPITLPSCALLSHSSNRAHSI
jgi:hypothetical protein